MAAPFEQHSTWSQRLENEFFAQGDKESEMGLAISPLMDRNKPGVMYPANQMSFCDVIVLPLFEAWAQFAPTGGDQVLKQARANRYIWYEKMMLLSARCE